MNATSVSVNHDQDPGKLSKLMQDLSIIVRAIYESLVSIKGTKEKMFTDKEKSTHFEEYLKVQVNQFQSQINRFYNNFVTNYKNLVDHFKSVNLALLKISKHSFLNYDDVKIVVKCLIHKKLYLVENEVVYLRDPVLTHSTEARSYVCSKQNCQNATNGLNGCFEYKQIPPGVQYILPHNNFVIQNIKQGLPVQTYQTESVCLNRPIVQSGAGYASNKNGAVLPVMNVTVPQYPVKPTHTIVHRPVLQKPYIPPSPIAARHAEHFAPVSPFPPNVRLPRVDALYNPSSNFVQKTAAEYGRDINRKHSPNLYNPQIGNEPRNSTQNTDFLRTYLCKGNPENVLPHNGYSNRAQYASLGLNNGYQNVLKKHSQFPQHRSKSHLTVQDSEFNLLQNQTFATNQQCQYQAQAPYYNYATESYPYRAQSAIAKNYNLMDKNTQVLQTPAVAGGIQNSALRSVPNVVMKTYDPNKSTQFPTNLSNSNATQKAVITTPLGIYNIDLKNYGPSQKSACESGTVLSNSSSVARRTENLIEQTNSALNNAISGSTQSNGNLNSSDTTKVFRVPASPVNKQVSASHSKVQKKSLASAKVLESNNNTAGTLNKNIISPKSYQNLKQNGFWITPQVHSSNEGDTNAEPSKSLKSVRSSSAVEEAVTTNSCFKVKQKPQPPVISTVEGNGADSVLTNIKNPSCRDWSSVIKYHPPESQSQNEKSSKSATEDQDDDVQFIKMVAGKRKNSEEDDVNTTKMAKQSRVRLCSWEACFEVGEMVCELCQCVIYCSNECLVKDWNSNHNKVCNFLKTLRQH